MRPADTLNVMRFRAVSHRHGAAFGGATVQTPDIFDIVRAQIVSARQFLECVR
jgi:hypothetical protein